MKLTSLYESKFNNKEAIIDLLEKWKIRNYVINDDLTIDVNGDVDL